MAERRMFAKSIIDSDAFLDMPLSAQALYFHLGMRADDDGFVNSPKKIMRLVSCSDDDMKLLITKNFIIPFDSGIVVIKHWRIHNYIRSDRYKPTTYIDEKNLLEVKKNNAYTLMDTTGIPSDIPTGDVGKDRLGKDRLGEVSQEEGKRERFTQPTLSEVEAYINEKGYHIDAEQFIDFYESKGWMVGKNKMKNWKAAVRTWEKRHNEQPKSSHQGSRRELFARLYEEHKDDL